MTRRGFTLIELMIVIAMFLPMIKIISQVSGAAG